MLRLGMGRCSLKNTLVNTILGHAGAIAFITRLLDTNLRPGVMAGRARQAHPIPVGLTGMVMAGQTIFLLSQQVLGTQGTVLRLGMGPP